MNYKFCKEFKLLFPKIKPFQIKLFELNLSVTSPVIRRIPMFLFPIDNVHFRLHMFQTAVEKLG